MFGLPERKSSTSIWNQTTSGPRELAIEFAVSPAVWTSRICFCRPLFHETKTLPSDSSCTSTKLDSCRKTFCSSQGASGAAKEEYPEEEWGAICKTLEELEEIRKSTTHKCYELNQDRDMCWRQPTFSTLLKRIDSHKTGAENRLTVPGAVPSIWFSFFGSGYLSPSSLSQKCQIKIRKKVHARL
jgi:hypothetical protein